MRLDCIETDDDKWQVIDYDNNNNQIVVGYSIEDAWYLTVIELEKIINSVISVTPRN